MGTNITSVVQGCGIKGSIPTSVIQGNCPFYIERGLWEALFVVYITEAVVFHSVVQTTKQGMDG